MIPIINSLLVTFLFAIVAYCQDFPARLDWQLEIEGDVTSLGSAWSDEGRACVLVGTQSQVHLIRDGQIIWSSPEIEGIWALSRILAGDVEMIVAATAEGNHSILHSFSGEGFEQHNTGEFGSVWDDVNGGTGERGFNNEASWICQVPEAEGNPDNSILIWCSAGGESWWESGYGSSSSGELFLFSVADMAVTGQGAVPSPVAPVSFDLTGDGIADPVLFGNKYSSGQYRNDDFHHYWNCGAYIWRPDSVMNVSLANDLGDGVPVGIAGATLRQGNLSTDFVVSIQDSDGVGLALYSTPDFRKIGWRETGIGYRLPSVITQENGEQYLLAMTIDSQARIFHLPDFRLVYSSQLAHEPVKGAHLADFNNDGSSELFILAGDTLSFYSIGELGVTSNDLPHYPSSQTLSPFPNPFNSFVTINYTLPVPTIAKVSVEDIAGRRVAMLMEGGIMAEAS